VWFAKRLAHPAVKLVPETAAARLLLMNRYQFSESKKKSFSPPTYMNRPAANGTYVMAGAYIKIYLSEREGKAITEFQNLCRATNWYTV
jgi:hypothetical protein